MILLRISGCSLLDYLFLRTVLSVKSKHCPEVGSALNDAGDAKILEVEAP